MYDCAHAMGTTYGGSPVCHYPGIFTYSLQAIKHVTSVEGGVLILHDEELWREARMVRWYGFDREVRGKDLRCEQPLRLVGFKMNQVDPNSAIGRENLKEARRIFDRHLENALYYYDKLAKVSGITLLDNPPWQDSSWWMFSMLVEDRSSFIASLADHGIMASRVHARNDRYIAFHEFRSILPSMDYVDPLYIAIPNGWWVSDEDREYIVDVIKKGW